MLQVFKRLLKAAARHRPGGPARRADAARVRQCVEDMNRLAAFAAGDATGSSAWRKYADTIRHYSKPETCEAYDALFMNFVLPNVPDFDRSHGLDFGCWLGLSTLMLARLGPASMLGVDVVKSLVQAARAFADHLGLQQVEFRLHGGGPGAPMPVESNAVDWVLANDVFSFANPEHHDFFVRDVARVLKPGGRFLLSDANNPRHEPTVRRLRATWPRYEYGSGGPAAPDGTYFLLRQECIRERFPDLDDDRVKQYAQETAYRWGEQIEAYVRARLAGDTAEASRFDPDRLRPVIHPRDGRSIGAITDPVDLMSAFRSAGLEPSIRFAYPRDPADCLEDNLRRSGRFYLLGVKAGAPHGP